MVEANITKNVINYSSYNNIKILSLYIGMLAESNCDQQSQWYSWFCFGCNYTLSRDIMLFIILITDYGMRRGATNYVEDTGQEVNGSILTLLSMNFN